MNLQPAIGHPASARWSGVIEQYARYLPVSDRTPVITLNEGNTPLIRAENFVEAIGGQFELHLKFEGLNPTCSFKDRGMTLAVSKAKERGAQVVICASTGNTSASAAAYAARARMRCAVLLPNGKIALGKLAQALMYGATTVAIEGNFDDALRLVRELGETGKAEVVNSINPVRIEGQKTAAFEICDQLGRAPDFHFLPVGNAGNITAYWKGYREYFAAGRSKSLPRMFGFQAAGAAPIVDGHPVAEPETFASAIRIGNPASWQGATSALTESRGHIAKVSDAEILAAYKLL
ncbi:MAG: threonine synthase, partial [Verrucomicrobiales bacterium]|nr:threonine synthase [Verrucomicrobiales bacterium]